MIVELLNKLENAVAPPPLPPTPFYQAASALRMSATALDKIRYTLVSMVSATPELEVVDTADKLLKALREGRFEEAEVLSAQLKNSIGYCTENEEINRIISNLARFVYLLVKDNLPTDIKFDLNYPLNILLSADWLLRNFGAFVVHNFFRGLEKIVEEKLSSLDSLLDTLATLSTVKLEPCALLKFLNDVEVIILQSKLTEVKIVKELQSRVSNELDVLAETIPNIAYNFDIKDVQTTIANSETLRQLGKLAANWVQMGFNFFPKERSDILQMRGGNS